MNIKSLLVFLHCVGCVTLVAQNNIQFQITEKDFAIWAYKQHNAICEIIHGNLKSGKLSAYNAKNVKGTD